MRIERLRQEFVTCAGNPPSRVPSLLLTHSFSPLCFLPGPNLMLVRDDHGAVFGAYTSDTWHPTASRQSYGTVRRCSRHVERPLLSASPC